MADLLAAKASGTSPNPVRGTWADYGLTLTRAKAVVPAVIAGLITWAAILYLLHLLLF